MSNRAIEKRPDRMPVDSFALIVTLHLAVLDGNNERKATG